MAIRIEKAKEHVLRIAKKMTDLGLVIGTWGNVSTSPEKDVMIITPSGMNYHDTNFADMVTVNYQTQEAAGRRDPSVETLLHCRIYQERLEAKAIVHTHSTYAMALAVAGAELPPITEEMASLLGGAVGVAEYAPSGSEQLAENVVHQLRTKNQRAALMANHGLVTAAETLEDALMYSVIIEKAAEIYIYAKIVGNPRMLTPEEADEAHKFLKEKYGQRSGKDENAD